MKMKEQQRRNQRHEHLHNQQLRLQRRCEEGRARLERETPLHKLLQHPYPDRNQALKLLLIGTNVYTAVFRKL